MGRGGLIKDAGFQQSAPFSGPNASRTHSLDQNVPGKTMISASHLSADVGAFRKEKQNFP